jgi:ribosomal protein S18 acetylase RimI-like enzyme
VTVGPSAHDGRIRTARLTDAGAAERALLDEGSDALAASLLAPLTDGQRRRLVAAMGEVERLLTAARVAIAPVDPAGAEAQYCLREYFADIDSRFPTGFDPDGALPLAADQLRPPHGVLLVASLGDEPVGCAGVKFLDGGVAEVKRMWVAPSARGLGLARRLLADLEARAVAAGATSARLDTNATLAEAIRLYRSAGYVEVEAFNDEPYAQHWFAKPLG